MLSAWFLGSIYAAQQDFTVDATSLTFNAGNYYLRSATTSLSMIRFVEARLIANIHPDCTVRLTRGRTVRITFDSARSITWGAATQLRDLLGFTGDAAAATTHDAPNVSPLLWSPGYLATPATIEGVDGYTVPHQAIYKSADGSQVYCAHYSTETWQDLSWSHIMPERMRVSTGTGGGTFHEFFEQCGMLRARFLYHQEIDELDGSTTSVTYDTARGPYVLRDNFDGDWYRRNVPNAEVSSPLDLPMQQVAEYA